MSTQREGWLGDNYVRVYAPSDRQRISRLYDFSAFLPGYEPWGSWGLDALCLGPDSRLYLIDWIPLDESIRRECYASIAAFEQDLILVEEFTSAYEHFQKEVHFVEPLAFGGDPKAKLMMVDQAVHAELCRFWNQTYRRIKNQVAQ
jgi:hypothetical protein